MWRCAASISPRRWRADRGLPIYHIMTETLLYAAILVPCLIIAIVFQMLHQVHAVRNQLALAHRKTVIQGLPGVFKPQLNSLPCIQALPQPHSARAGQSTTRTMVLPRQALTRKLKHFLVGHIQAIHHLASIQVLTFQQHRLATHLQQSRTRFFHG